MPVLDHATGDTLEHQQLHRHPKYRYVWNTSYSNKLSVGHHPLDSTKKRVEGTNTFHVIAHSDILPSHLSQVTYTKVVCEYHRPQKEDPNRTPITIGGNRIRYPGDCGTKTASLELVKLQLNSVFSRPGAKNPATTLKISTLAGHLTVESTAVSNYRTS